MKKKIRIIELLLTDWKEQEELLEQLCDRIRKSEKKIYPYTVDDTGGDDVAVILLDKLVTHKQAQKIFRDWHEDTDLHS